MATKKAPAKKAKRGTPSTAKKAAQKNAIAARRRQVAALSLAYASQQQIAAQLGVSTATISTDLTAIRKEWQAEARMDIQSAAMRELQSLDRLESTLWSQLLNIQTRRVRVVKPDGSQYEFDEPLVTVSDKTQTARAIISTKQRRAKMLGFDQPDLLEVRISSQQVQDEISRLRAKRELQEAPRALDTG